MAGEQDTAYPQLNGALSPHQLSTIYLPSDADIAFVRKQERSLTLRAGLLVHLMLFRHLGRFVSLRDVSASIITLIVTALSPKKPALVNALREYDETKTRYRHLSILREHLGVRPLDRVGMRILEGMADEAAVTKEAVSDIINVLLEELVRGAYELPAFETLNRLGQQAQHRNNKRIFEQFNEILTEDHRQRIDRLLSAHSEKSSWQALKEEPKRPTPQAVRRYLSQVAWRQSLTDELPALPSIPVPKHRQMLLEARALDASEMRALKPGKRYALALLFIHSQLAQAIDNAAEVLIRLVREMTKIAQQRLEQHTLEHASEADALIERFRHLLHAVNLDESKLKRLAAIEQTIDGDVEKLIEACERHLAYASNNYLPFLLEPYRRKRALLFECLNVMQLRGTSEDHSTLHAVATLKSLKGQRKEYLEPRELDAAALDALTSLPKRWQVQVWNEGRIHRKYFELAIFNLISMELSSGDLALAQGQQFDDYREQLIDDEIFEAELATYGQLVELPTDPTEFVSNLKQSFIEIAQEVDTGFSENGDVTIQDGRLVLRRPRGESPSKDLGELRERLAQHMGRTSIVDILVDTEQWLNLHEMVGPLSGHEPKIRERRSRFVSTIFCYGCNLGPTQTAQSIKGFSRKQIAWLNLKQITEDQLDKMNVQVINAYNRFELPNYWGSGRHVAADGTKWDLYEENLMSTYHIRYGGYGGIGYYHVSDKYIALFSHFIPCGVREAIYILDGLMRNESEIQPEVLHGDSHAQTFPVFALAYLLGIELMPRMRDLNRQQFFRPEKDHRFEQLEPLFTDAINWDLIERHLPDMLRIAISIKTGHITASTVLQRLGTYSRKNKVYFAFRELGRVVKTMFLLRYISSLDLRQSIHAATNKCEEFNAFTKWVFFGGEGIIAENIRHEQIKVTKYNHLVSNLIVLHNVDRMTRALAEVRAEGFALSPELLSGLAPYWTAGINRFGDYTLNVTRKVEPMAPTLAIIEQVDEMSAEGILKPE